MHTQFFSAFYTELSTGMEFLGSSQCQPSNLLLMQEPRDLRVPSALIRAVGWSFRNIQLPANSTQVGNAGETEGLLQWIFIQPTPPETHGSMTLFPKKRRYKSSSYVFAIKITIVLLKDER